MNAGRTVALFVVSGVAVGLHGGMPAATCFATALACAGVAVLPASGTAFGSGRFGVRTCRAAALYGCLASAAALHGAAARDALLRSPLTEWFAASAGNDGRGPAPVWLSGVIVRDAEAGREDVRFVIDVRSLDVGSPLAAPPRSATSGRVQILVAGALAPACLEQWTAGRTVTLPASLRAPRLSMNPGGTPVAWQALRRPFQLIGVVKSAALVQVAAGTWWDEAGARARRAVRRAIQRQFPGRDRTQTAALVAAVLIGDRAGLDERLVERLQAAGTYHVVAISGGNVAMVTFVVILLLRCATRSPREALLIAMVAVALYGWLVGGDPSVRRATLAACLCLSAALMGVRPPPIDVLAFVATLLAVVDPTIVADVGAWLSFGATLALILVADRWQRPGPPHRPRWRRVIEAIVVASLAAEAAVLPISAAMFAQVTAAGPVLNLIAIPAMAIIQLAGAASLLLANLGSWLGGLFAGLAHVAATVLIASNRFLDIVPWLSWAVPPPSPIVIATFYGTALTLLGPRRPWTRVVAVICAASVVVIATGPFTTLAGPTPGVLRFTSIDVGQGDALLLQFPTGDALLVDAGGTTGAFDVGGRVVAPALWASGVRRLDWLAATHPDIDHIGGTVRVARLFHPGEIWEGIAVGTAEARMELRRIAADAGMAWRTLRNGDRLDIGAVSVEVLHPAPPDWERRAARNDDSLVLRVRYHDVELLLTGDIGAAVEREIDVAAGSPLRVLKVAHHGSRTSTSAAFVERYRPDVAIVSAGSGNSFGHPVPEVVNRLRESGARLFRTDQDGAIIVETDGAEVRVRTISGRAWSVRVWPIRP